METLEKAIKAMRGDFDREIPRFSLEVTELTGLRWGAISEWETRLTLDGGGNAKLLRRRDPGDSDSENPGRFSGQVHKTSLEMLLEAIETSGIESYRTETPGPGEPIIRLSLLIGEQVFEFSWGFSRNPTPKPMARLQSMLTDLLLHACPKPIWCLTLDVESMDFTNGILSTRLRLENKGPNTIHLLHPASPGMESEFGIHLNYAEARVRKEGYTPAPLEIKEARFQIQALNGIQLLAAVPGKPNFFDFSTSLEGHGPNGWMGKFDYIHYQPEDTLAGVPIFLGAVFTKEISW